MLEIQTIHHVSLPVTDLARAKRFYEDVLGLEAIERPNFPFPGAWYRAGEGHVHLIVSNRQTLRIGKSVDSRDIHFAIRVKSYRDALHHLRDMGYSSDAPDDLHRIRENPNSVAGFPQVYVLDPDRNVIELNADRLDA
jgi:catechol 2,3-dioxygenase-like lactoylglutathione lyase family enzyme